MAKVSESLAGSSCHLHLSLTRNDACAIGKPGELSELGSAFLAGLLRYSTEFMVLHAPYANSYRRFVEGSWAPSNLSWGYDNRTCCVRAVGDGPSFRFEFRAPGADANPYLSLAAVIAAGLEGVKRDLAAPPPVSGDAYAAGVERLPADLTEAVAAFASSDVAARAFGTRVRDHFAALAASERDSARKAVTDWDLRRGFERA